MFTSWLPANHIQVCSHLSNWQQAITHCAQPLIDNGSIDQRYLDTIFRQHLQHHNNFVIAEGIAMPHSRAETGVNKTAIALLLIKEGVNFGLKKDKPVFLVILLATLDTHSHFSLITQLAELLSNKIARAMLLKARDKNHILAIIKRYSLKD